MVREVASKTSDVAGDGTTTATLLAQSIFREGVKAVAAGAASTLEVGPGCFDLREVGRILPDVHVAELERGQVLH